MVRVHWMHFSVTPSSPWPNWRSPWQEGHRRGKIAVCFMSLVSVQWCCYRDWNGAVLVDKKPRFWTEALVGSCFRVSLRRLWPRSSGCRLLDPLREQFSSLMPIDVSCALQTLEAWAVESVGEHDVALAMWTTFFVDDRHAGCCLSLSVDP